MTAPFPKWNAFGLIPGACTEEHDSVSSGNRAPYAVSLLGLVERFGGTNQRLKLLAGLLEWRALLHHAGLMQGFQWINGSFIEDVEQSKDRPPNDIDVVTFFHVPKGETQASLSKRFPNLSDRDPLGSQAIHSSVMPLNSSPEMLVNWAVFYSGLFSHTRNGIWKGFFQITLNRTEDLQAQALLIQLEQQQSNLT